MILLLGAGAAEAQLVSTTGQGQGVDGDFQNDRAQEFTTGSDAPGYNLTRVDLRVLSSASTTPVYTVEIRNDNGALPGSTVVGTLSNPTTTLTSSYRLLQFTAPAGGVSLDSGTDYWVVVDVSTGDANTKMQLTNSDGEDSGAAAGWSVANVHRIRSNSATTWDASTSSSSVMMAIYGGVDYDTDDDGLIEVANLAQLDAIRYDMNGNGIATSSYQGRTRYAAAFPNASTVNTVRMGCPIQTLQSGGLDLQISACSGYELTADLDFDTDGDGDVDADDDYWNSGAGWRPLNNLPLSRSTFTATFEGNGHVIDNLFMNITIYNSTNSRRPAGFFNRTGADAVIRNLGLTNVDMTATPQSIGIINRFMYAGALVGENAGTISGVFVTGKVTAENVGSVGGLVGRGLGGTIRSSYAMVRVKGGPNTGGLTGDGNPIASYATGTVLGKDTPSSRFETLGGLVSAGSPTASYATGRVWTSGTIRSGGLVGNGCWNATDCIDSYWDSATSGLETGTNGVPKTTAELQEPTGYSGIYANWNLDLDDDDTNDDPWDFGTSAQYPALKVDMSDADTTATWQEFGYQLRAGPTLTLTQNPVTQVNLSWTAVDVSHWNPAPTVTYTVYRLAGTTLEILSEGITTLSYADTDITTGDTYSYQVVAEVEGGEAARSEVLEWTVGVEGQPYRAARLRDLVLILGAGYGTAYLGTAFTDPDGDTLTYDVEVSDTEVLSTSLTGALLTLAGLGPGQVTVTVTAKDPGDLSATQVFNVTVRAGTRDHDLDDDNLIDVATLAQLDAMRHDLDGDGVPSSWQPYYAAFAEGALDMGCAAACEGYELTADLDFDANGSGGPDAGDAFWNGGAGWEPIGSDSDPFMATFEGGGHVVSNLFINRGTQDGVGLFGHLGVGGSIRRFGVADVSVTGYNGVGGLVGRNQGEVEWCFATGAVTGNDDVGGVAGDFSAGDLRPCYAAGKVTGNDAVGGLVGRATADSSLIGSYAASRVTGNDAVGGLVGSLGDYDYVDSSGTFSTLNLTYATGRVEGREAVGGLVGRLEFGTIFYSYATGYVTGQNQVGPLVGAVGVIVSQAIVDSYWDTDTSGHTTATHGIGHTTPALQQPTGTTGIYYNWNPNLGEDDYGELWDFGTSAQYPVLRWDQVAQWQELGHQLRSGPELTADPQETGGAVRVALSWSRVDNTHWSPAPTIRYTLTRSDGTTTAVLAEATNQVEHVDADVPGSGTYAYQVAAVVNGAEATRSAIVEVLLVVTRPPRPPLPPTGPDVTVSFAQATYEAEEGASAVAVTVQLSAAPERAVTIPLTARPGGGATAADYRVVPDSVTFGEDSTVAVFMVAALADAETDAGESVVLGFGALPAGVSVAGQSTVEVSLVDTTVSVFFERPSYVAAEGGAGTEVAVRLSAAPARAVTVPLTATPQGGATAADYTGVPASVTFGRADTMRAFTVTVSVDADDDDGESVSIGFGTLPATLMAGSPTSATVNLADAGGPGFEGDLDAGLPVRAVHLVELRLRVDALRRAHGLAAFAWTDAAIEPGVTPVRAVHPTELRTALDEVCDAAGRARFEYTDDSLGSGVTVIRAVHFLELRNAIVTLEGPRG